MHQFSSAENWVVRSPVTFFSGLFFLHLLLCCFMPVCSMLFSGLCAWYVLLYPISCRLFSVASVPDTFLSHVLHAVFWSLCQTHACNFIPCFAGCFLVSVLDTSLSHVSQAVFWSLCLIPLTISHVLQAVFWSLCLIPVTTPVSPSCPIAGAHTGTSATLQVGNGVSRVGWFDNRMSCAKKGHFTYIFE